MSIGICLYGADHQIEGRAVLEDLPKPLQSDDQLKAAHFFSSVPSGEAICVNSGTDLL